MMRLDEIKKFDSMVLSILEKTVDKGIDVNFDPDLLDGSWLTSGGTYAEIAEVNYWSVEKLVQIHMVVFFKDGDRRRTDWKYRPLSAAQFDETFTLKKIDGTLTFTKREAKQIDEAKRKIVMGPPLDMRAEFILGVIESQLRQGKQVPANINLFGRFLYGKIKKVQRNTDNSITFYAAMPPNDDGDEWTSLMTIDSGDFAKLRLVKRDGELQLVTPDMVKEEHTFSDEAALFVSMLQKLLRAGKTVYARAWVGKTGLVFGKIDRVDVNDGFDTLDVHVTLGDGMEDIFGYTLDELSDLTLRNKDGAWYIMDRRGNYR